MMYWFSVSFIEAFLMMVLWQFAFSPYWISPAKPWLQDWLLEKGCDGWRDNMHFCTGKCFVFISNYLLKTFYDFILFPFRKMLLNISLMWYWTWYMKVITFSTWYMFMRIWVLIHNTHIKSQAWWCDYNLRSEATETSQSLWLLAV